MNLYSGSFIGCLILEIYIVFLKCFLIFIVRYWGIKIVLINVIRRMLIWNISLSLTHFIHIGILIKTILAHICIIDNSIKVLILLSKLSLTIPTKIYWWNHILRCPYIVFLVLIYLYPCCLQLLLLMVKKCENVIHIQVLLLVVLLNLCHNWRYHIF